MFLQKFYSSNSMLFPEFFSFIRVNICTFGSFISGVGFLLFNQFDLFNLALTFLSSFFIIASVYSINNITDTKEDIINRKKINFFAQNPSGRIYSFLLFSIALILSFLVSSNAVIFILLYGAFGVIYSTIRVKEFSQAKNIYTGILTGLLFLIGATAFHSVSIEILAYFILFSYFIFIASFISDLRDIEGDSKAGVLTAVVKLGKFKAKKVLHLFALIFFAITFFAPLPNLKFFGLLSLPMFYLAEKEEFKTAHGFSGIAIILFFGLNLLLGFSAFNF